MIRFAALAAAAILTLLIAIGGGAGIFGGVALLAVWVAGFGLIVALCTELMRES